jgi:hypothetical protein
MFVLTSSALQYGRTFTSLTKKGILHFDGKRPASMLRLPLQSRPCLGNLRHFDGDGVKNVFLDFLECKLDQLGSDTRGEHVGELGPIIVRIET